MLNQCNFIGRLTRDPEKKELDGDKVVTKFSLAVDRGFGSDEADFINIVAWGKTAVNTAKYLSKGSLAFVSGRHQVRSWEKDGQKRNTVEIVAREVVFLDSKKREEEDDEPF